MKYKYGEFKSEQVHDYKKRMHSLVHWLLIYAEEENPTIDKYFETVQTKLNGLNELIGYPTQLIEIMALVESAKLEYHSDCYEHSKYRGFILDAHELIDRIEE